MSKPTKLIVLAAFNEGEDGELLPAFDPREIETEEKARLNARMLAGKHAGVIAWSRDADLVNGEFGDPVILFQHGKIPEME